MESWLINYKGSVFAIWLRNLKNFGLLLAMKIIFSVIKRANQWNETVMIDKPPHIKNIRE